MCGAILTKLGGLELPQRAGTGKGGAAKAAQDALAAPFEGSSVCCFALLPLNVTGLI